MTRDAPVRNKSKISEKIRENLSKRYIKKRRDYIGVSFFKRTFGPRSFISEHPPPVPPPGRSPVLTGRRTTRHRLVGCVRGRATPNIDVLESPGIPHARRIRPEATRGLPVTPAPRCQGGAQK